MNKNEYVIITGGTSGIGLEFAKKFASEGYNLVLLSRVKEHLLEAQNNILRNNSVTILIYPCDLTETDKIESFFDFLKENRIVSKILVNNAGFANLGEFIDVDISKQMNLIDLNIKSLTIMTKLFLDQFKVYNGVRILNVSSIAGIIPGPCISVYAASKAFVYSFSQSIASELKAKGAQVSVLCPADVKTNFQKRAGIDSSKLKMALPEELVRIVYKDFMNGKRIIIPTLKLRLLKFVLDMFPENGVADSLFKKREKLRIGTKQ